MPPFAHQALVRAVVRYDSFEWFVTDAEDIEGEA